MLSGSTDKSTRVEIRRNTDVRPWTYTDLDVRQREVLADVRAGAAGRLLLSELAPVITLGLRETRQDLTLDEAALRMRGVPVVVASRGGRATYHGPGQWVVFPVDSLERMTGDRRGVRKLVDALLDTARDLCRVRFPGAEIRDGKEAGVWTRTGGDGAKIVALGLRIDEGIVQHGLAFNVFRTPESFAGLRPCGLDAPVGFLENAANPSVMEEWGSRIETAFLSRFSGFV